MGQCASEPRNSRNNESNRDHDTENSIVNDYQSDFESEIEDEYTSMGSKSTRRPSKISNGPNTEKSRKNSKVIKDVYIKDLVKKSGCGETFVINFDSENELNKKKKPLRLQQVRPKGSETRLKSAFVGSESRQRPKKKNHANKGGKATH